MAVSAADPYSLDGTDYARMLEWKNLNSEVPKKEPPHPLRVRNPLVAALCDHVASAEQALCKMRFPKGGPIEDSYFMWTEDGVTLQPEVQMQVILDFLEKKFTMTPK